MSDDGREMPAWKTLESRVVYENGKWITLENRTLELPDGQVISGWTWVRLPEYINVAVVTASGHFLCFRQRKYAVEGVTLAPVGGYIDPGETPLMTAQRELREETGYTADDWQVLGRYAVDGNRGAGVAHLFLATGAVKIVEPSTDDLEDTELTLLTRDEAEAAVRAGAFKVLAWAAVMALALLRTARD